MARAGSPLHCSTWVEANLVSAPNGSRWVLERHAIDSVEDLVGIVREEMG